MITINEGVSEGMNEWILYLHIIYLKISKASHMKFLSKKKVIGRFYARDIKVVLTHLASEILKSSVKSVIWTHLTEDVNIRH